KAHLTLKARHDGKAFLVPAGATGPTPETGITVLANDVTIRGFDISGFKRANGSGTGILVGGDDNVINFITSVDRATLSHNRVHDDNNGIYLQESSRNRILDNVVFGDKDATGVQGTGIVICVDPIPGTTRIGQHNLIAGNRVSDNDRQGIYDGQCSTTIKSSFDTVTDNTVVNNSVKVGKTAPGLEVYAANDVTVTDNVVTDNTHNGIDVQYSDGTRVEDNWSARNVPDGIFIGHSTHITVRDNTANHNGSGIVVSSTNWSTFVENSAHHNSVVDLRWDGGGTQTFHDNKCTTASPSKAAWDCG
ncbi:MAG TPA: right-handed parallel beta-helix repeat-containing protein, partial [Candidatus Dormibacteraeota bacterium]|nr:right-handed parallel beta-helix repeat-containing protein [Candidatus Dormibacteraeota bacterium]